MKIPHLLLLSALAVSSAQSASIANWKEFNPAASPGNSGLSTDSPTIGDGTANNADNAWVAGRFGTVSTPASVTLAVGETLTVSGSVVLTGGIGPADQFRFGVFDDGGQFALGNDIWPDGGWIMRPSGGTAVGLYQARTDGAFVSTNPNSVLLTSQTISNTGGAWTASSATPYNWSFSVTRASSTTVDLFASLNGGTNGFNETATRNGQSASAFTYTAVGLLLGGGMDLDQAQFSNVQYNVIPEPSTTLMAGLAGLALMVRKRRLHR